MTALQAAMERQVETIRRTTVRQVSSQSKFNIPMIHGALLGYCATLGVAGARALSSQFASNTNPTALLESQSSQMTVGSQTDGWEPFIVDMWVWCTGTDVGLSYKRWTPRGMLATAL